MVGLADLFPCDVFLTMDFSSMSSIGLSRLHKRKIEYQTDADKWKTAAYFKERWKVVTAEETCHASPVRRDNIKECADQSLSPTAHRRRQDLMGGHYHSGVCRSIPTLNNAPASWLLNETKTMRIETNVGPMVIG